MNSEREIVKRLFESKDYEDEIDMDPIDEKTYTVGDTQYWKRGGKCYSWTSEGGKQECSEEEYMKAISGGSDNASGASQVKNTEPHEDMAKPAKSYTLDDMSKKMSKYDGVIPINKGATISTDSKGDYIYSDKNHPEDNPLKLTPEQALDIYTTKMNKGDYKKIISDIDSKSKASKSNDTKSTTPKTSGNDKVKDSPYAKYGFSKKPTIKKVTSVIANYLPGDPARDISHVLFDRDSKVSSIVNRDLTFTKDARKGTDGRHLMNHYEGSVDRLMKNEETRNYYDEYLEDSLSQAEKSGDSEAVGVLSLIRDKWLDYKKTNGYE